MARCSTSDPCRAEVIYRAAVAAQSIQLCPGLSVVACRFHGMKQRSPSDAGSGTAPDAVPVGTFVATHPPVRDAAPSAAIPDAAMPDPAMPSAAMPDDAIPDGAMPNAAMPNAAMPDAAMPGAEVKPAAESDVAVPDDGSPWAGLLRAVDAAVLEPTWRHGEDDLVDRLREYET